MDLAYLTSWQRDRSFFTISHLKILACLTMFLSHLAQCDIIYSLGYTKLADLFMLIGRMAMPLFCFMLVQGMVHTKDKKSYILRLFIFALISEIPYDLACRGNFLDFYDQNVIFTLFLGACLIFIWQYIEEKSSKIFLKIPLMLISYLIIRSLALELRSDYHFLGIRAIALLYFARQNRYLTILALFLAFNFESRITGIELAIPYMVYLSIPPVLFYNGHRGSMARWISYVFYPGHFLLIYFLKVIIF